MIDLALSAVAAVGAMGLLLVGYLFARSLLPDSTPLVHRFAQAEDPVTVQRPSVQRYLRGLTVLWAAVLIAAAYVVGRRAIGYPVLPALPGTVAPVGSALLLFFGERWVRRVLFGKESVGPVARQWRIATDTLKTTAAASLPLALKRMDPVVRLPDDHRRIVIWRDRECSVNQLQAAAWDLAARLPGGRRVLVVCEDRAVFLWVVLAAWAAGRTVVLPPPNLKYPLNAAIECDFDCIVTDRPNLAPEAATPVLAVDGEALRSLLPPGSRPAAPITLSPSHVAAIFFTSGSTGQPAAHAKTWQQLASGADAMEELLDIGTKSPLLGGTVIHSHKFGFEMLIMQTLRGSAAVYAHRIVYPSDLEEFCKMQQSERWLITTPYHLELFVGGGRLPTGLTRIVSATMPLAPELAARVERGAGAEVHEIYGSTEAGCIATRRTASGLTWRLAGDLSLVIGADDVATLHGDRVGGALDLRDRVARADGGFELYGRDTDLVKIAGKRASLQALTAILRAIDGVQDGAFIDGTTLGQKRLAAFVVAPQLSGERIRNALAQRIDAAFLPRPLVLLDALPRDANGKLNLDALAQLASEQRRPGSPLMEGLHSHAG